MLLCAADSKKLFLVQVMLADIRYIRYTIKEAGAISVLKYKNRPLWQLYN